ncbi:MAG TPA: DUF2934 domain-containing protein [Candidatus Sulfopaludibacter sp.]|jgi:hypothetical protein|nr:DUF2934 domain-containing protein [Candidatus Sulfopaludibacter sp.]
MSRKRSSETELAVSAASSSVPARRKPTTSTRRKKLAVSPVEVSAEPVVAPAVVLETVAVTVVDEPAFETVAALAYSYWVARGCQGGSPEEDWLRAEHELRSGSVATA